MIMVVRVSLIKQKHPHCDTSFYPMSDDPFTSVQLDRDDRETETPPPYSSQSGNFPANPSHPSSPSGPTEVVHDNTSLHSGVSKHSHKSSSMAEDDPQESTEPSNRNSDPAAPELPQYGGIGSELLTAAPQDFKTAETHQPDAKLDNGMREAIEETNETSEATEVPVQPKVAENPLVSSPVPLTPIPVELVDQKRMEEQFHKYYIRLRVSQPLSDRDSNSKSYISYLITTESNHPEVKRLSAVSGDEEEITVKVRRRYGDFRFLHDCLTSDFPHVLVPPLPAKLNFKYLTGDTFSTAFVHKRLNSLDRFVSFICSHKLLSQLSVFHFFVSDSGEWATFTKNLKISKGGDDHESSLVGKVANEEMLTETVMNFFTSSKHKRETNKDILEISDKLKKICENLLRLDKLFSRLNKKNYDLKTDYEQLLSQIIKLAAVQNHSFHLNDTEQPDITRDSTRGDTSVADSTRGSELGLELGDPMVTNFRVFSQSLLYFLENWAELHRYIDESFLVSLKDCAKYIARFSDLIEFQHNKRIDLQVLNDYLAKARSELAGLGRADSRVGQAPNPVLVGQTSGGIVNNTTQLIKDTLSTSATSHVGSSQTDAKRVRAQQKIQQLEAEISTQTQLVNNLTSRIINEEYPNWEQFNKRQLRQLMSELCDQEIKFYRGLADQWSEVEVKLVKRLEELNAA